MLIAAINRPSAGNAQCALAISSSFGSIAIDATVKRLAQPRMRGALPEEHGHGLCKTLPSARTRTVKICKDSSRGICKQRPEPQTLMVERGLSERPDIPSDRDFAIFPVSSRMLRLSTALALCLLASSATAQDIPLAPAMSGDVAARAAAMPALARAVITVHPGVDTAWPETLFRAQLVAGDSVGAVTTLKRILAERSEDPSPRVRARDVEYLIYATAGLTKGDFATIYEDAFRVIVGHGEARATTIVVNNLSYGGNLSDAQAALDADFAGLKGKSAAGPSDAAQLIRDFNDVTMYTAVAATLPGLIAEDDDRRYVVQKDLAVPMPDGATVCTLIVRPRGVPKIPALLQFTIYNDAGALMRDARRSASSGYAGVLGLTRGKGCSSGPIVPYIHDGADAAVLIDWIAAQPWSDGQVGMYGGSYSGFTPWAAAKFRPKALKAIMVGAPGAPGIDSPMEGDVFWSFLYPWPFYTTDNKTLDNATYGDNARWNKLYRDWYVSGRAYGDLDKISGTPNPVFDSWIAHETYDSFWQSLIPYKEGFANLNIAVLQTAGYYAGGPGAATYFFNEFAHYNPGAENYLVIGPYDHFIAQRGTATPDGNIEQVGGYTLDAAALTDFSELRFCWFDYILKRGPRPAVLADRVNYEVTGANVWKHAPSLTAMAGAARKYYLSATVAGAGTLRLVSAANRSSMPLAVDLADRRDADRQAPGGNFLDKDIDMANSLVFVSDPFARAAELSGLFSGRLDFVTNKRDFDFQISLYEKTAAGAYFQLAPYWSRASQVADISHRQLLTPGKPQTLSFRSRRLMSHIVAAGSRLVVVLGVIKDPGRQINYGSGKPVMQETIADAGAPLTIRWQGSSFIAVPLGR